MFLGRLDFKKMLLLQPLDSYIANFCNLIYPAIHNHCWAMSGKNYLYMRVQTEDKVN